jgi:hypothetical protein
MYRIKNKNYYKTKTIMKNFNDLKGYFNQLSIIHGSIFIYVNMLLFLTLLLYNFLFSTNNYAVFIIITLISFLIFTFGLDRFKFSKNSTIRILQQVLFIILLILILGVVYLKTPIYCSSDDGDVVKSYLTQTDTHSTKGDTGFKDVSNNLDSKNTSQVQHESGKEESISVTKNSTSYTITVNKDVVEKGFEVIGEAMSKSIETIVPNSGAGAAAGAIGAGVFKATSSLPPLQRITAVGVTTLVGAASAKVGIDIGTSLVKHGARTVKNSAYADPDVERIPSPDGEFFINSLLESGESQDSSLLFILIRSEFLLNLFILILIISFLILIFNKYILSYNIDTLSNFFAKRSKKIHDWLINKNIKNKSNFYNKKIFFLLFIINTVILLYVLTLNLFVSALLLTNLDEYIQDHINITKSVMLFMSLKSNLKLK